METAKLCACGCGEKVNKGRQFIHGHNGRGQPSARRIVSSGEPPLCACGCGEPVSWNRHNCEWNKFVFRHGRKGAEQSKETKAKISATKKAHGAEISAAQIGRKASLIARANMAKAKIANPPVTQFKTNTLNPAWKHGKEYKRPSSSILARIRRELIERRGFLCEKCEAVPLQKNLLEMHHCDENTFNNAPDNLQLLCHDCHNKITHGAI